MRKIIKIAVAAAALVAMAGTAQAGGDAAKGEKVFKKCKACHSLKGKVKVGPPLNGVVGRVAGTHEKSVKKKKYHKGLLAVAKTGFVWTAEEIAAYSQNPKKWLEAKGAPKKTKMSYKLKGADKAADVAAYLATLTK